jgi:hypothetical protein
MAVERDSQELERPMAVLKPNKYTTQLIKHID